MKEVKTQRIENERQDVLDEHLCRNTIPVSNDATQPTIPPLPFAKAIGSKGCFVVEFWEVEWMMHSA